MVAFVGDAGEAVCSADVAVFAAAGAGVLKIPARAPRANAYAEHRVRTAGNECLGWVLVWIQGHLRRVLTAYLAHDNGARPHRGLGLNVMLRIRGLECMGAPAVGPG